MQIKFNYTEGGEFKLTDETSYVGYFSVSDDSSVYTGKYIDENSKPLSKYTSGYSIDYHISSYFKDRYIFDTLKLPRSYNDIKIGEMEIVTSQILNDKIGYLNDNLLYMYSKMYMGSTDLPYDNQIKILANTEEGFDWSSKNTNGSYRPVNTNLAIGQYTEYDNLKKMVVVPFPDNDGYNIFGISDTHLMCLTSADINNTLSGANFVLYTDVIDNNSLEKCKSLQDITVIGSNLFISDSAINGGGQVFKYDITGYTTKDAIFENKRFLIEPIGGSGTAKQENKFKGCTVMGSNDNEIWIYDQGNNKIKVFDKNFVWKASIKVPKTAPYTVLDIRHRKMDNTMIVLYSNSLDPDNIKYGLFIYDSSYNPKGNIIEFGDKLFKTTDIGFKRLALSEQDSNVFYVITEVSVHKKFFSKPEMSFGVFDRDTFNPKTNSDIGSLSNVKDIFVLSSEDNSDNLFFAGKTAANALYITYSKEKTVYISILKNEQIDYYDYSRINIESSEYNQSFVLNKELYKIFSNILQFRNQLKGRFFALYDDRGDLRYKDYVYILDEEINTIDVELEYNSYINDNELVQPNVINRLLWKIYDFQTNLLKLTNVKLSNIKVYNNTYGNIDVYPIE